MKKNSSNASRVSRETKAPLATNDAPPQVPEKPHNKTALDYIATLAIPLAAIFISVLQYQIASKQKELVRIQTEIARQQVIPQFAINARQVMDEASGKALEDRIYVNNYGALARGLDCKSLVLLNISFQPDAGTKIVKEIPLTGYYFADMFTNQASGLGITIEGHHNNEKLVRLEASFRGLARKKGAFGTIDIKRYVRLTYRDALRDEHADVYSVELLHGGVPLEPQEADKLFPQDDTRDQLNPVVDLDDLTPEKLLDLIHKT